MIKDLKKKPRNFSGIENHLLDDDLEETNRKIALAKKAHDEGRAVPAKEGFARLSKKLALKYPNADFEEFVRKNPPPEQ